MAPAGRPGHLAAGRVRGAAGGQRVAQPADGRPGPQALPVQPSRHVLARGTAGWCAADSVAAARAGSGAAGAATRAAAAARVACAAALGAAAGIVACWTSTIAICGRLRRRLRAPRAARRLEPASSMPSERCGAATAAGVGALGARAAAFRARQAHGRAVAAGAPQAEGAPGGLRAGRAAPGAAGGPGGLLPAPPRRRRPGRSCGKPRRNARRPHSWTGR
mmetsp:Transcript_105005/g.321755  ORF Transcript_105005/g.321755 Transcript_105005/m.321755 type:complete len:220 (+) Transcript_105005:537-1196(+)